MSGLSRSFAILPAAGRSRRMGRPKLLLPWEGRSLLEHGLEAWLEGGVTRAILVAHPDDDELHRLARRAGAEVVVPHPAPEDMQASLAAGLRHVAKRLAPQPEDVWLAAPADLPYLSGELVAALLAAATAHDAAILAPRAGGRLGHPLLLRWPLAQEFLELPPGAGLKALRERHGAWALDWHDERIHDDLDSPDDYERLQTNRATWTHAAPGSAPRCD